MYDSNYSDEDSDDDKVSEILKLPRYVRPIGIITLGYPTETEPVGRLERLT